METEMNGLFAVLQQIQTADDAIKEALLKASETDTMLIMRSIGATHRGWNDSAARRC